MSPTKQAIEVGQIEPAGPIDPVFKNIRVRANAARAFKVFTEGFDSWWPKSHHIGDSPMTRAVIEGWLGGRCYGLQENGAECQWGRILEWEPPQRFVMAWQVTPEWKFEPETDRCSEVEVNFTPQPDGTTLVELWHRHFERHGVGADKMRNDVNSGGGWAGLLELFRVETEKSA